MKSFKHKDVSARIRIIGEEKVLGSAEKFGDPMKSWFSDE